MSSSAPDPSSHGGGPLPRGGGGARDLRRGVVTEVSPDGTRARVLLEYLRLVRPRDPGSLRAEPEVDRAGLEAEALPGLEVGDEVLVDLRPLPVLWLSFLYFGATVGAGLLVGAGLALPVQAAGLPPAPGLLLQVLAGLAAAFAVYRHAEGVRQELARQGRGTPAITTIMPRLVEVGEEAAEPTDEVLMSRLALREAPEAEAWEFARGELERVVGVRRVELHEDRVEVVYRRRELRERHLLELLVSLGVAVELGREPVD